MTRVIDWDEESAAGALFVELNGGTWEAVDGTHAPDSGYDILVTLPSGGRAALEVTQHTNQAIRRQRAIEARYDWSSDQIEGWWDVSIAEPCDIPNLHRDIFGLVAELAGTDQVSLVVGPRQPADRLAARFHALGVRLVHQVADGESGHVNISPASQGGSTGPSVLVDIAENHANRADNAHKLAIADVDERHMWIWVTFDRGMETAAVRADDVPGGAPRVPDHIDCVWIAAALQPPTVWRWCRTSGWARALMPADS